jgi:hypothetical protein
MSILAAIKKTCVIALLSVKLTPGAYADGQDAKSDSEANTGSMLDKMLSTKHIGALSVSPPPWNDWCKL